MFNASSKKTTVKKAAAPTGQVADDATASVPTATWNPWWALLFVVVVYLVSQLVSSLIILIYPWLHHWSVNHINNWSHNSIWAQFFYVLIAEALVVGAIYGFLRSRHLSLRAIGLKKPRWADVGYGALALPVYFALYVAAVIIIQHVVSNFNVDQQQDIGFTNVVGAGSLVLTFISLVVLPPLAEEIMVRGFLFSSLKRLVPVRWAILLTSLIFASAHLPEGGAAGPLWIAFIDTCILSLALCYLREKTGSLWAGITLHALKNGIAYYSLFIVPLIHFH
ncbi:MAG TPA: type II CAAX endopeptidase family protein [Candidatus Saccharimonadales bacterium]|nr:type II CAAX endopeptidase family protein [Candidatus Saccharimonadales bacterium]